MKIGLFGRYVEIMLISKSSLISRWYLCFYFAFQAFSISNWKCFILRIGFWHDGFLQFFLWNQKQIYLRETSVEYMVFFIIQERPICLSTDQYALELLNGSTDFFDKREQNLCFSASMETPRRLWRICKFSKSWLFLFLFLKGLYISFFFLD